MGFCCLEKLCRLFRLNQIPRAYRIHYTLILRFVPLAGMVCGEPRTRLAKMQATACSFQKRSLPFHSIAQIRKTLPILFGFKPKSDWHQNITGTKLKQPPARNRRQFRIIQYFHHKLLYTLKNESEPNGLITDRIPPHIKISIFFLNDAHKK